MAVYHSSKPECMISDKGEILRLFKAGKYAVIAMCRNNEPYAVTLSYGYDEKTNSMYFHSALKGLKIDFIKDNSRVCAIIIEDLGYIENDCQHKYSSLAVYGKMSVIDGLDEKKYAMEAMFNHLEKDPLEIKKRFIKSDKTYDGIAMMKLEIESVTAKSGK